MKIISSEPGKRTEFHKDDSDGVFTIRTLQDVNPILEHNKALQALNDGFSPSRELKRVASIPTTIVRKWCKDAGISFRKFMRRPQEFQGWLERKLKDPENRFLLTAPWFTHKYSRPQPSGIIGLDNVVREGRKIRPRGRLHALRERIADAVYDIRSWLKALDNAIYSLQARIRG